MAPELAKERGALRAVVVLLLRVLRVRCGANFFGRLPDGRGSVLIAAAVDL